MRIVPLSPPIWYFPIDRASALTLLRPGEPFQWNDSENYYDYDWNNGQPRGLNWLASTPKPTLEEIEAFRVICDVETNRNWDGVAAEIIDNPILFNRFMKALTGTVKTSGLATAIILMCMPGPLRNYERFVETIQQLRIAMANAASVGDFTEEEILLIKNILTINRFDPNIVDLPE